jgi:N-acyl-D-aspartate/D-glutamate deacylase
MAADISLVVRNGTVIDGTGAPAYEADVAISDGKIVQIGNISARGAEEIDARGKLVTPGFVDIHTHYDAQAVWDTQMTPSSWHGVTTGVMGNCGVGFAPCRIEDRQKLVELMEGVEDIPGAVMAEGLTWEWESFGEYLSALERRQRDIDLCALLPHAAVRVFVMGERAIRHEAANQGDIAQMRQITEQAIRDGAFGVSTSRTISHKSLKGEYTPTLRAAEEELTGLAMGMKDAGAGFLELVGDWNQPDPVTEFAMVRRIIEKCGRTAVFSITQRHDRTEVWKDLMAMVDECNAAGVSIRPVAAPRAIGILLGLEGSQNPFSGTPTYKSIAHLPLAERVKAMRDPEIRAKILSDDPVKGSTFPLFHRMSYTKMFRFGQPA